MIREQVRSAASGVPVLIAGLAGIGASAWLFVASVQRPPTPAGILLGVGFVFHYALEALGKISPRALGERALVLCALAAIWGALAFGVGVA